MITFFSFLITRFLKISWNQLIFVTIFPLQNWHENAQLHSEGPCTLLFLMRFCYQASFLREMSRFANWTYFPEEPCSKPFWLKQFERYVFPTVSEKGRKGRRTEERIKWFWNISQWVVKQVRDKVVRFYLACNLHAKSRTRSRRAIQAQMGGGSLLLSPIFFFGQKILL